MHICLLGFLFILFLKCDPFIKAPQLVHLMWLHIKKTSIQMLAVQHVKCRWT